MKMRFSLTLLLATVPSLLLSARADLRGDFADPPPQWKSRPLWFWNAPPTRAETRAIMEGCRASGYHGFGILPTETMKLEFMSPAYLDRYAEAVETAAKLGLKMCLYDEFWFPSGGAGGVLAREHPEALGNRLDLHQVELTGPQRVSTNLPPGVLMAAVAMRTDTFERVNLARQIRAGRLEWDAPAGSWRVMLFACVRDGARGLVDYLDPVAVRRFIDLTYAKYFARLGPHFGRTIDSAFYDEPTFHWIEGGRAWTPSFNERFRKQRGYDPALLYPALWFDIGPDTAAARHALFGFRAELFATGFVKTIADWCRAHGIELTGHVDQEEVVNPVGLCGDLIKAFEHQPIPGIDQIFQYARGAKAYKVVSSAVANYDRRLVMTECYGAMDKLPLANLYREAMDQFAKGINVMVPHAVWYDPTNIVFPPELSYRTEPYASELPAYNRYVGRLQRVLQQGYPQVDIAVLYPIAGLEAGYRFGVGKPYEGGVIPPEADYMDLGELLAVGVRHDFTFLHPEVLDAKCRVRGSRLELIHPGWRQPYQVVFVPGGLAISASNLRVLQRFQERGGRVVFTTRLPEHSAEFGRDRDVRRLLEVMLPGVGSAANTAVYRSPINRRGGRAYYLPQPRLETVAAVLEEALPQPDVGWETRPDVRGGYLSYLHKVVEGRHVYFFANSSDTPVDTWVRLHGAGLLERWDPHTGAIAPIECLEEVVAGRTVRRVRLGLPPVQSVFLVGRE